MSIVIDKICCSIILKKGARRKQTGGPFSVAKKSAAEGEGWGVKKGKNGIKPGLIMQNL